MCGRWSSEAIESQGEREIWCLLRLCDGGVKKKIAGDKWSLIEFDHYVAPKRRSAGTLPIYYDNPKYYVLCNGLTIGKEYAKKVLPLCKYREPL